MDIKMETGNVYQSTGAGPSGMAIQKEKCRLRVTQCLQDMGTEQQMVKTNEASLL